MKTVTISCFVAVGCLVALGACSDDTTTPGATGGSGGSSAGAAGTPAMGGSASGAGGKAMGGMATGGGGAATGGGGAATGGGGSGGGGGTAGGTPCDPKTGKAVQFKNNIVDIIAGDLGADLPAGNSARTIELWAKFEGEISWAGEHTIIEIGRKIGPANQVFGIDMADRDGANGKFDPYSNGVGDNDPTPIALPAEGWHHLAWGYDGAGHFQFVVDGVKATIPHPGDGTGSLDTTPGIVTLGASQSFGHEGWEGAMDEVRIWKVYRTPADILRDMKIKLKGTEADLVAYYPIDEGVGMTVDDVKKTATHQLKFCSANGGACPAMNAAAPTWVDSDIPGPFTCAP